MANGKKINYSKLFAIQSEIEKELKVVCPNINHKSGIYFLIREDKDENKKYFYIGKGVDICRRMISHRQGWKQSIDVSLKKRGWYSPKNEGGWKLNIINFPESELDEKERYYIDLYLKAGYEAYNVESGGTTGKTDINQRKAGKGYHDGVAYGTLRAKKQVKEYFDRYLDYTIKGKPTKIKEKKFAQFGEFLNSETDKTAITTAETTQDE